MIGSGVPSIPNLNSSAQSGAQGGDLYGSPLTQNFGKNRGFIALGLVAIAGAVLWANRKR